MDKSYVTVEQLKCRVCCTDFDSGALLLDKRFNKRFERHTLTGWGLCPECTKKKDDGYIAFVECDPTKGGTELNTVFRTGQVMHMRKEAVEQIFNVPITTDMAFLEVGAIAKIQAMVGTPA